MNDTGKEIWYLATAAFHADTISVDAWQKYVVWSGLHQAVEIVSLDGLLNHPIIAVNFDDDALLDNLVIEEDSYITRGFFRNLAFVLDQTANIGHYNLLAVIKEPSGERSKCLEQDFEFVGYDLIEKDGTISALTNCGGFDETFNALELNQYGLIDGHQRVLEIRRLLAENNPQEVHADCFVFEVWRHRVIGRRNGSNAAQIQ